MNMLSGRRPVYPLMVVLTALSLIEITISSLYINVTNGWEKIPLLVLIVMIPIAIVSTFLYLWIARPGHLYPPSEFGTGETAGIKLQAFYCNLSGPILGTEAEFSKSLTMLSREAEGEAAICILETRTKGMYYCQCSFSREKDTPGVFKFICSLDDLTYAIPVLARERRVDKIIVEDKSLFNKLMRDNRLASFREVMLLAHDHSQSRNSRDAVTKERVAI